MTRRARLLWAAVAVSMAVAWGGVLAASPSQAQEQPTVWLCRPGIKNNPCESSLTTTVVHPDGKKTTQRASDAKDPPVDCFYVYPTVSAQPTVNANLDIDPELVAVAENQAARFSQVCRVYAPVYPQLTLSAIGGGASAQARATAYAGVLAGWKDYLAKYNKGRGVVFIGHSQGSGMLIQLLKSEVDPNPKLRRQTVSALLLGGNVTVPEGQNVGGDFQNIPACRSAKETHCVVAYSMYAQQPPADGLFGKTRAGAGPGGSNLQVLCVNPASFTGVGSLEPYLRTTPFPGPIGAAAGTPPTASTPWVAYPKLYSAQCQQGNGFTWLQITDVGKPEAPRYQPRGSLPPNWGLHLGDINLALGNLVDLARQQAAAYRK
ncbi:MAG TPA: DUF3089 domain-containing protein [Acidimicrobiia bacterium]|nr:DUF3089 domain-containing protein [Acidimicrobiia bacterium]